MVVLQIEICQLFLTLNMLTHFLTNAFVNPRIAVLTQHRLGRVLNRFTYDVEVLDIELSVSMAGLMISLSWLVAAVIVMVRKTVCYAVLTLIQ
jgi:hypothetical protein